MEVLREQLKALVDATKAKHDEMMHAGDQMVTVRIDDIGYISLDYDTDIVMYKKAETKFSAYLQDHQPRASFTVDLPVGHVDIEVHHWTSFEEKLSEISSLADTSMETYHKAGQAEMVLDNLITTTKAMMELMVVPMRVLQENPKYLNMPLPSTMSALEQVYRMLNSISNTNPGAKCQVRLQDGYKTERLAHFRRIKYSEAKLALENGAGKQAENTQEPDETPKPIYVFSADSGFFS